MPPYAANHFTALKDTFLNTSRPARDLPTICKKTFLEKRACNYTVSSAFTPGILSACSSVPGTFLLFSCQDYHRRANERSERQTGERRKRRGVCREPRSTELHTFAADTVTNFREIDVVCSRVDRRKLSRERQRDECDRARESENGHPVYPKDER